MVNISVCIGVSCGENEAAEEKSRSHISCRCGSKLQHATLSKHWPPDTGSTLIITAVCTVFDVMVHENR